jgi:hypothetical protein
MKRKTFLALIGCFFFVVSLTSISLANTQKNSGHYQTRKCDIKHHGNKHHGNKHHGNKPHCNKPHEELITVLNPMGIIPEIQCYPMADRFENLEGKTIYVVDVKYPSTTNFGNELMALLQGTYPTVNWVYRQKKGTYFENDPDLWNEIKAQGAGMIIFIGH